MKTYLKLLCLIGFTIVSWEAGAQSKTPPGKGWPLSKEVLRFTNKSLANHKLIKLKSVGTPAFVQSKDLHKRKYQEAASGNVRLTGTPNWIYSKPTLRLTKTTK